jgi:hypothetical protein
VTLRLETKEDKMGIKMTGKNREKSWSGWFRHILPILTKADTWLSGRLSLSIGFYIPLRKVEHPLKKSEGCFKDRGTPLGVGVWMSVSGKEQSLKPLKPSSSLCFIS